MAYGMPSPIAREGIPDITQAECGHWLCRGMGYGISNPVHQQTCPRGQDCGDPDGHHEFVPVPRRCRDCGTLIPQRDVLCVPKTKFD